MKQISSQTHLCTMIYVSISISVSKYRRWRLAIHNNGAGFFPSMILRDCIIVLRLDEFRLRFKKELSRQLLLVSMGNASSH